MQIIISKGAICVPLDDQEKTYLPCLRIELPGSFMRRCLRIELRSELYAKGALCGSTVVCGSTARPTCFTNDDSGSNLLTNAFVWEHFKFRVYRNYESLQMK